MKKAMIGGVLIGLVVVAVVFYFGNTETSAQVKAPNIQKVAPKVKVPAKVCMKADLALWKDNTPFGTKDEFPYSTPCKNCFEKLGVMNLPTMSVWVANKGSANAPASKAKMTWQSGKAPFGQEQMTVNVPAIEAGGQTLLTIPTGQDKFFQTAKPVKLQLDSANQIDECNENNNTLTYTYR